MTDLKFTNEYKRSVESIALPRNYQENILSAIDERKSKDSQSSKTKARVYKYALSAAAVLVLLFGLAFTLFAMNKLPSEMQISFKVSNATNLSAVKGARIVFVNSNGDLLTDDTGEAVEVFTDDNGEAQVTIPNEGYVPHIDAEGYIPFTADKAEDNYYISPEMNEDTYRAVLTWETECDLDAHLSITKDGKTEKLHYFNSSIENDKGEVIAALDTDSETSGYPETITFNCEDNALIRFSVASYSALKEDSTKALSDTSAQVTLYRGEKLLGVYSVQKSKGNVWCVFEIENGELKTCSEYYSVGAMTEIK